MNSKSIEKIASTSNSLEQLEDQSASVNLVQQWLSNPFYISLIVLALVPPIFVIWYISQFAVDIPYIDSWGPSSYLAVATSEGRLKLSDLISDHGGHRLLLSNIVVVVSTILSNWDQRFEMFFSVGLAIVNFCFLMLIQYKQSAQLTIYALLPFSVLTFSMAQYDNWVWAFQTPWFFMLSGCIIVTYLVTSFRPGWFPLIIACSIAFLTSMTFVTTILIMPTMLLLMFLSKYRRPLHYAVVLIVSLILYFLNSGSADSLQTDIGIVEIVHRLLIYLGRTFVNGASDLSIYLQTIVGLYAIIICVCALVFIYLRTNNARPLTPWIGFIVFSLSAGLFASAFRWTITHNAAMSRYQSAAIIFWIGLVAIIIIAINLVIKKDRTELWEILLARGVVFSVLCLGLLQIILSIQFVVNPGKISWQGLLNEDHQACLLRAPIANDYTCLDLGNGYSLGGSDNVSLALFRNRLTLYNVEYIDVALSHIPLLTEESGSEFAVHEDNQQLTQMGTILRQELRLPKHATFEFQVSVKGAEEVIGLINLVTANGEDHVIFERELSDQYYDIKVNLSEFAGQEIVLEYELINLPNSTSVLWDNPRIRMSAKQ